MTSSSSAVSVSLESPVKRVVAAHNYALLSEFIHLISSEANEICEQDSKKTIAPDHIISALKVQFLLGWNVY